MADIVICPFCGAEAERIQEGFRYDVECPGGHRYLYTAVSENPFRRIAQNKLRRVGRAVSAQNEKDIRPGFISESDVLRFLEEHGDEE